MDGLRNRFVPQPLRMLLWQVTLQGSATEASHALTQYGKMVGVSNALETPTQPRSVPKHPRSGLWWKLHTQIKEERPGLGQMRDTKVAFLQFCPESRGRSHHAKTNSLVAISKVSKDPAQAILGSYYNASVCTVRI